MSATHQILQTLRCAIDPNGVMAWEIADLTKIPRPQVRAVLSKLIDEGSVTEHTPPNSRAHYKLSDGAVVPPKPAAPAHAADGSARSTPAPAKAQNSLTPRQTSILDALSQGSRTSTQLGKALQKPAGTFYGPLKALVAAGHVVQHPDRSYGLPGSAPVRQPPGKKAPSPGAPQQLAPVVGKAMKDLSSLFESIDKLEGKLKSNVTIADIEIKVATLNKLAALLDKDIATVLLNIRDDLQKVAG